MTLRRMMGAAGQIVSFYEAPFTLYDATYIYANDSFYDAYIQFREAATPGDCQLAAPLESEIVTSEPLQYRDPDSNNGTYIRVLEEQGPDMWDATPAGYSVGTWLHLADFVIGTGFGGPSWRIHRDGPGPATAEMTAIFELSENASKVKARATITLRATPA